MSPRPIDLPEPENEAPLRLAREGRCAEALQAIEAALENRAHRESRATAAVAALSEVARLAGEGGDAALAERVLERALELRPKYPDLHFQLAMVLLGRHRRAEARQRLDAALRLNPRFSAARLERALLDAREGLVGEALEALASMARDTNLEDPRAFQQGLLSLERAEWDEADSLFKRALNLSDPELKQRLEEFRDFLERGEAGRAAQSLRGILPRHEGYPDLHHLLGLAELKLGRFDDALVSFARALQLNPDFHDARVQFAHTLECLGDTAQAGEQLALVLQGDPSNRRALELHKSWSQRSGREHRGRAEASGPTDCVSSQRSGSRQAQNPP